MLDLDYSLQQGLIYGGAITLYLLIMMMTIDARVWGYNDYPEKVKRKVRPPSESERKLGLLVAAPFFVFMSVYPLYSVYNLKTMIGGSISFITAFSHLLVLAAVATFGDLVLLDWLIISKITPRFVVIEGSEVSDYKDFSHHYIGHVYASLIILVICALVAYVASSF